MEDPAYLRNLELVRECRALQAAEPRRLSALSREDSALAEAGLDASRLQASEIEDALVKAEDAANRRRAVRAFVRSLPERQQQIVRSVFWDDRSQADTASRIGISQPAVSKQMSHILARGFIQLAPLFLFSAA